MDTPDSLGRLKTDHWAHLQDLASRFEKAWGRADSVDLQAFLPPPGDPLRRVALVELVKAELEIRWKRGQVVGLEAYLEKFPELGPAAQVSADLVYEEFRVRHLYGDRPPLASYQRRFPARFAELERLAAEQPVPTLVAPAAAPAAPAIDLFSREQLLRLGGGYRLIKRIGCGGFAEVWQAETPGGFPVAIKRVLRSLDQAEAQMELRALSQIKQLSHPYLLQTRDYDLVDNHLYIVMDLADGTLSDRLKECKAAGRPGVPEAELLRYFREAAEALDYMHGEKVYHRDIKPKNILLHKGHAKVADFGLARLIDSQRQLLSATTSGTAAYMPPEVWRRQVSPHTDQYSLAVSYAELRLGRLPFTSSDMFGLMMDHLEGRAALDALPPAEQQVLHRALAKEPDGRYPSCTAFVSALEEALAELAPRPPTAERLPPRTHPRVQDMGTMTPADTPSEALPPVPSPPDSSRTPPMDRTPGAPRPRGAWRPPRSGANWPLRFVATLTGGALVGVLIWYLLRQHPGPEGSFTLEQPAPLQVRAGGEPKPLIVRVRRDHFRGTIRLVFPDLPPGVHVQEASLAGDAEHAEATVQAGRDALPGAVTLTVRAEADNQPPQQADLTLTIEPGYWRAEWERVPGALAVRDWTGRAYYRAIDVVQGGKPVRFVLVPQRRKDDLPTYYIMENKVWNDLFAAFAAGHPEAVKASGWKPPAGPAGRHPALGMTVEEAARFAAWLGGKLPSADQWDRASGFYEPGRGRGPFREPVERFLTPLGCIPGAATPLGLAWALDTCGREWGEGEIAIRRENGPLPVGAATHDVSPYGCRDMAGNGREWTEDLFLKRQKVPLMKIEGTEEVVLRGRRSGSRVPFLFKSVERLESSGVEVQPYGKPDPDIGFRVVIEPQ